MTGDAGIKKGQMQEKNSCIKVIIPAFMPRENNSKGEITMCTGLANGGYIPPKEEKKAVSLIKPYTNFDRIKEMTVEELAERMTNVEFNIIHEVYDAMKIPCSNSKLHKEHILRQTEWKHWLESEAEK